MTGEMGKAARHMTQLAMTEANGKATNNIRRVTTQSTLHPSVSSTYPNLKLEPCSPFFATTTTARTL